MFVHVEGFKQVKTRKSHSCVKNRFIQVKTKAYHVYVEHGSGQQIRFYT
jgi:hypothetical protein